jgi:hypothetical protein
MLLPLLTLLLAAILGQGRGRRRSKMTLLLRSWCCGCLSIDGGVCYSVLGEARAQQGPRRVGEEELRHAKRNGEEEEAL